jgi:hypothetical protein
MRPGADKKLKTSSSLKFDIESNSYAKEYKTSLVTQSYYAKNFIWTMKSDGIHLNYIF